MESTKIVEDQFREFVLKKFRFLEDLGFHHVPDLDESSPTSYSITYVGTHVGFVFSLDVRDQCVDAQVVKICNGKMKSAWEGGYSSGLYMHLIKHAGYRGNPSPSGEYNLDKDTETELQRMINGWAELLRQAGQTLLADQPDSLPSGPGNSSS